MIAHRYSMVKDADGVIVLDGGQIKERGAPRDLIGSGDWFARLAHATGQRSDGPGEDSQT